MSNQPDENPRKIRPRPRTVSGEIRVKDGPVSMHSSPPPEPYYPPDHHYPPPPYSDPNYPAPHYPPPPPAANHALPVAPRSSSLWPRILIGAGMVAVLLALVFVIGYLLGNRGPEPVLANGAAGAPVATAPQPAEEDDMYPRNSARAIDPTGIDEEPLPQADEDREPPDDDDDEQAVEADEPARISFEANEFFSVYVKLDERQLFLNPVARVRVPSGTYTLSVRESPRESWHKVRKLRVESGQSYRVKMNSDPLGASVQRTR